jgi:hypothetical protein
MTFVVRNAKEEDFKEIFNVQCEALPKEYEEDIPTLQNGFRYFPEGTL